MRKIAIANQKGGVGKTTTALNLVAALAERGRRTLLIDVDPQSSLTLALGFKPGDLSLTITDVLLGERVITDAIMITDAGPDLIPSNFVLSGAAIELTKEPLGAFALKDALTKLPRDYDYVMLDCPPNLGVLTLGVLLAADQVLIPLQADYLAMKGVNLLLQTIEKVQRRANPGLTILGIVLTMADRRTRHARDMIRETRRVLKGKLNVFETVIRMNVRLKEAAMAGRSIFDFAPESYGAKDYRALAEEVDAP